ncbi:protease [Lithospermum erythrorhizon]|uniref:Signal peptidase complex subunit 1 n=1 Tax=Lithospermum erythrorhizon TaxID=34254 RepID=A0AAV3RKE2_LITER
MFLFYINKCNTSVTTWTFLVFLTNLEFPTSLTSMDWQGQKVVEQLMQILLLCFAVVAFVAGYVLGSFQTMMLVYAGGVVFTCLLTVPNWSFFNRHPLKWLEPSEAEKHPKPEHVSSSSKKKNSKK